MQKHLFYSAIVSLICSFMLVYSHAQAQTGSGSEPVRYIGGVTIHQQAHDGQLRLAVGVESFQVMRANRSRPDLSDGFGWTYNHAPMITYWNGRYALIYNPVNDGWHRWPLAIVTGDDGVLFDNMICVQGEVPPRRFKGYAKDFGPQYNRSIEEGNGKAPGSRTRLAGRASRRS